MDKTFDVTVTFEIIAPNEQVALNIVARHVGRLWSNNEDTIKGTRLDIVTEHKQVFEHDTSKL
jgi:hypothetical protein